MGTHALTHKQVVDAHNHGNHTQGVCTHNTSGRMLNLERMEGFSPVAAATSGGRKEGREEGTGRDEGTGKGGEEGKGGKEGAAAAGAGANTT